MKPGWLISAFLLTGLTCISARADAQAPAYLLVPERGSQMQATTPLVKFTKQSLANDAEITVGANPTFTLEFADVRDNTGLGFDDPQQGSKRRAVAVSVFERVSQILNGNPGSAKIILDSRSPWLTEDTLAIGLPFFQCANGFQKPIIQAALTSNTHVHSHEGEMFINFDLPQSAELSAPVKGKYDLYTSMFHEMVHILGFVGFTVESDGLPADCGGARMLPAIAEFGRDESGNPLWGLNNGEVVFLGQSAQLPTAQKPMKLELPLVSKPISLYSGNQQVTGHWMSEDFGLQDNVLMLGTRLPTSVTRRNLTPESKAVLDTVLEYHVAQDLRGLTGAWIDTQLHGQGFTIQFIDKSTFAIFFYGFADNGERMWLVGLHSGEFSLGQTLSLPLFEASGGQFNHYQPASIDERPWGEMDIRFSDCFRAEVTLSGLDGVVDMSLVPLARVDGLDCY